MTTTNFAEFGYKERAMATELLNASVKQGFPEQFNDDEVQIVLEQSSGSVFFTNSDCDVCMMNGDKLEMWYFTPYEGHEGFADDLKELYEAGSITYDDDIEYLRDCDIIEGGKENA